MRSRHRTRPLAHTTIIPELHGSREGRFPRFLRTLSSGRDGLPPGRRVGFLHVSGGFRGEDEKPTSCCLCRRGAARGQRLWALEECQPVHRFAGNGRRAVLVRYDAGHGTQRRRLPEHLGAPRSRGVPGQRSPHRGRSDRGRRGGRARTRRVRRGFPVQRTDGCVRCPVPRHAALRRHLAERAGRGHRVERCLGRVGTGRLRRDQRRVGRPGWRCLAPAGLDPATVPERGQRVRRHAPVSRRQQRGVRHHGRVLHRHASQRAADPRLERRRLQQLRDRPRGRGAARPPDPGRRHRLRAADRPQRYRRDRLS